MEPWVIGAIVGGVVGGVAAAAGVARMNKQVRANPCPRCGKPLGEKKPATRTWKQFLAGGWTCPSCGCDVDRFGKERLK